MLHTKRLEEIGNAFFINFESIKFFDENLNKTLIFVKWFHVESNHS